MALCRFFLCKRLTFCKTSFCWAGRGTSWDAFDAKRPFILGAGISVLTRVIFWYWIAQMQIEFRHEIQRNGFRSSFFRPLWLYRKETHDALKIICIFFWSRPDEDCGCSLALEMRYWTDFEFVLFNFEPTHVLSANIGMWQWKWENFFWSKRQQQPAVHHHCILT